MTEISFFNNWNFDVKSCLITIIGVPILLYFLAIIRRYIKSLGSYAIEGLMYWASRFFKKSLAGALSLKHYCRLRLAGESRYLFVPSSLDIKLPIDEVFVSLSLGQQGGTGELYSHRDILTVGNRIRVVGEPGSGKSSLIKRLFRDACCDGMVRPSKARLPILIELKTLTLPDKSTDFGDWFVNHLKENVNRLRVYQMDECFDSYVENSGLIILLDGLDEVSSVNYPNIQSAIIELSKRLSELSQNNVIVLTMRTQFHQQVKNEYRDCFGPALFLKSFSPTDIYDFLTRWPFIIDAQSHIARIYGELTDRPTLREMCSNPLILAMYVAEDQAAGHVVAPESRTEFYRKVTEELIIKRRLQQIGPTPAYTMLREQRERILGKVAYSHMIDTSQSANSLEIDQALSVIVEVTHCAQNEARNAFDEIAKETGLISEERVGQTFRFNHLTFCEFLAAFEAIQGQKRGWIKLIEAHRSMISKNNQPELRARLVEVIPFACGLLPRIQKEKAISDVENLGDDDLLARCFLETKYYSHSCWLPFVERQKNLIMETPETGWDGRWLGRMHLFNVVLKDSLECSKYMPVSKIDSNMDDFFKALAVSQKEVLAKILASYAAQDAAAAFRLAEISGMDLVADFPEIVVCHCDQPPFLALVLERALRDLDRIGQWSSMLVEAALRSKVVAYSLNAMNPSDLLAMKIRNISPSARWDCKSITGDSLYIQLISIALNDELREVKALSAINILKEVRSPGGFLITPRTIIVAQATVFFLVFVIVIISSYSVAVIDAKNFIKHFNAASVSSVMAAYFMFPLMMWAVARKICYRDLIIPNGVTFSGKTEGGLLLYFLAKNRNMINGAHKTLAGRRLRDTLHKMNQFRDKV